MQTITTHIHSVCAAILQYINTFPGSDQSFQSHLGQKVFLCVSVTY